MPRRLPGRCCPRPSEQGGEASDLQGEEGGDPVWRIDQHPTGVDALRYRAARSLGRARHRCRVRPARRPTCCVRCSVTTSGWTCGETARAGNPRRSLTSGTGDYEPHVQPVRRHARGRAPHGRHWRIRRHPSARGDASREARTLRDVDGGRYWRRDGRRYPAPDLRPVLHDEGPRQGRGLGSRHGPPGGCDCCHAACHAFQLQPFLARCFPARDGSIDGLPTWSTRQLRRSAKS